MNIDKFKFKKTKLYMIIFISAIFYVILRAYLIPFTHDESVTFLLHIPLSIKDIIEVNQEGGFALSNNHVLNTLLMKLSSYYLGNNEFFLRLPNVLAYVLYLLFSFLIALKLNSLTTLFSFLIINLNLYVLEFFSLGRGYGLGLGFMMASLYFLYNCLENQEQKIIDKNEFLCSIFATLSVLSNFAFLYFYLSSQILNFLVTILKRLKLTQNYKRFLFLNLPVVLTTYFLYQLVFPIILKLQKFNELNLGGNKGFFQDTIWSLVESSLYGQNYNIEIIWIIDIIISVTIIISGIILIWKFIQVIFILKNQEFVDKLLEHIHKFLNTYNVLIIAFSIILANFLLEIKFPVNRAAIFLIPLIALMLLELINYCFSTFLRQNLFFKKAILFIIVLIYSFHFFSCANFFYTFTWKYDADVKEIIQVIEFREQYNRNEPISLGVSWVFQPSLEFYRKTHNISWLQPLERLDIEEVLAKSFDYYYVIPQDWIKLNQVKKELVMLKISKFNKSILAKVE